MTIPKRTFAFGASLTIITLIALGSAISFAGIAVTSQTQITVNSELTAPVPISEAVGYTSASGYLSFSGIGYASVGIGVSAEASVVDLANILELLPSQSGTIYLEYTLPAGVTMYLNSVIISILFISLTLSGTAYAGTGSLAISGPIDVTASTPLYLSFVMDGNAAFTGSLEVAFAPG